MSQTSTTLTEEIRNLSLQEGAYLFGVAGADRFEGAPRDHHPAEIVRGACTVISLAIPPVEQVSDWEALFLQSEILGLDRRKTILHDHRHVEVNYNFVNDRLSQIAHRVTCTLQAQGHRSMMFPATFGSYHKGFQEMMPGGIGIFSQCHAAARAGLGEFGLYNVVVPPRNMGPGSASTLESPKRLWRCRSFSRRKPAWIEAQQLVRRQVWRPGIESAIRLRRVGSVDQSGLANRCAPVPQEPEAGLPPRAAPAGMPHRKAHFVTVSHWERFASRGLGSRSKQRGL